MGAPLYSRFRRYLDRDIRSVGEQHTKFRTALLKAKNQCLVYSLDENAARDAGLLSTLPPAKLNDMLDSVFMPHTSVWVELPFRAYMQAAAQKGHMLAPDDGAPTRLGVMFITTETERRDNFGAVTYYQQLNGATVLAPAFSELSQEPQPAPDVYKVYDEMLQSRDIVARNIGVGLGYAGIYAKSPGMKRLASRLDFMILKSGTRSADIWLKLIGELNGSARMALAIMSLIGAAGTRRYVSTPLRDDGRPLVAPRDRVYSTEITLHLDFKPSGEEAHRAIRKAARARHRLHHVMGHYSYRHRSDDLNPRLCHVQGRDGQHAFEKITDIREECVHCGQQRWFRADHDRGDPTLGTAQPKVRAVKGVVRHERG